MPGIKSEITIGNLISILTTFIVVGGLVWHLSDTLSELRGTDRVFEQRIAQAEARLIVSDREWREVVQKMARIEANSDAQLRILQRLERIVDGTRRTELTPDAPAPQLPR